MFPTSSQNPRNIVSVRIDPNTGEKATGSTEGAIFEVFREEDAPGGDGNGPSGEGSITRPVPVVTPPPTQDLF